MKETHMIFQIRRLIIELIRAKSGSWTCTKGAHVSTHIISLMHMANGKDNALSLTVGRFNIKVGMIRKSIHELTCRKKMRGRHYPCTCDKSTEPMRKPE